MNNIYQDKEKNKNKNENNKNQIKKIKFIVSIIKLIILFSIMIIVPIYLIKTYPDILSDMKDIKHITAYLEQYKTKSIFIYVGLQVLQVLVSILPGQVLQMAAGYIFKLPLGLLLTSIGLYLGSIVTFFFARILGKSALHILLGEEKLNYFVNILNSKRAYIILFVIFLIPGIPKDLCCYAAGISEIKLKPFLAISIIGRMPGIIGSVAIGNLIYTGSYTGVIILAILSIILFILGIKYRERLIQKTNDVYNKWVIDNK